MDNYTQRSLWLFKHKLKPFLIELSELVRYELSISDIDAIEYGIFNTVYEKDIWWTYRLAGDSSAYLAFALDGDDTDILFIRVKIEETLTKELTFLIFMLETFELKEIYPIL